MTSACLRQLHGLGGVSCRHVYVAGRHARHECIAVAHDCRSRRLDSRSHKHVGLLLVVLLVSLDLLLTHRLVFVHECQWRQEGGGGGAKQMGAAGSNTATQTLPVEASQVRLAGPVRSGQGESKDGCQEHVRTASKYEWNHGVTLLASHKRVPRPRCSGQTPGGGLRRSSMLQCSACCGAGLSPPDERQHGAHCPPQLASPATRRRTQLRWQLRLPPQAIAASRAGRIYQRHRRRRAESPDAAKVSAGADFSQADIVGPSPVVAPVAPLPALPRKGLTGLAARVVFGVLLGVSGAIVILTGGWFYMAIACLVAYQASQEYFGFVTSKVCSQSGSLGCPRQRVCPHGWHARLFLPPR